jgi:hypothetical protein
MWNCNDELRRGTVQAVHHQADTPLEERLKVAD